MVLFQSLRLPLGCRLAWYEKGLESSGFMLNGRRCRRFATQILFQIVFGSAQIHTAMSARHLSIVRLRDDD